MSASCQSSRNITTTIPTTVTRSVTDPTIPSVKTSFSAFTSLVSLEISDPLLRVEAQVFLVVNDPNALDFNAMAYGGNIVDGRHQAKSLPSTTGEPVLFRGSTTGPSYDQHSCSPAEVTWNVRPQCAKLDINSLHRWAEQGNVFNEKKSHGVRQLVTAPELLSRIE